jgi:uncharacterized protein YjiS (DUF1127 family)
MTRFSVVFFYRVGAPDRFSIGIDKRADMSSARTALVPQSVQNIPAIIGGVNMSVKASVIHRNSSVLETCDRLLKTAAQNIRRTPIVWRHRMGERRELAMLNNRELKDCGISREKAQAEIRKPFWQD